MILPALVALILLASPGDGLTGNMADFLDEHAAALLAESHEPGLAVVLIEGGRVTLCEGYGLADREAARPVGADTLFNVGSVSKSMAAWIVMSAVDAGDLALDQPVTDLVGEALLESAGDDAAGVTIGRLLSHTAGVGMPSVTGYPVGESAPSLEPTPSLEDVLADLGPLVGEPGTGFAYSGGGYGLLQLALERQSGLPFARLARRSVLGPLGMQRSDFATPPAFDDDVAVAYSVRIAADDGQGVPDGMALAPRTYPVAAAAGFWTSARDLGRFLEAHMARSAEEPAGRGILRPETLVGMGTPVPPADRYGLGYELPPPLDGHAVFMHTGTNLGWKAHLMVVPDLGIGIGALTNTDAGETLHAVMRKFRDEAMALASGEHRGDEER